MTLRNLVLIGALTSLIPTVASSQATPPRPAASVLFRPVADAATSDTLHLPRTYWKEGALIGGIPAALFGLLYVGPEFCRFSEDPDYNCTLGTLASGILLGATGAFVGLMIGGQFPKE